MPIRQSVLSVREPGVIAMASWAAVRSGSPGPIRSRSEVVCRRVLGDHCSQHELDAVAQVSDHGRPGLGRILSGDGLQDGPVRLVRDDDNVAPGCQEWVLTLLAPEKLNRREDKPADIYRQKLAHLGCVVRLNRPSSQRRPVRGEGSERLVVEIVPVRDKNNGWVLEFLRKLELAHKEKHSE